MKKMLAIIAKRARFLRGFLPKRLPLGSKEFESFCESLFYVYDLPGGESYQNAVATMILHLSPTTAHKSPYFFAKSVKKSMANQVAYEVIQKIREQEKQAEAALKVAPADTKATLTDVSQNQAI